MNKFNLLYYFFLIFTFVFLINFPSKTTAETVKEKKGFKEIDLNKDGKINYYEFQKIRQRRFDRLDLNNDGNITQNEFEKSMVPDLGSHEIKYYKGCPKHLTN